MLQGHAIRTNDIAYYFHIIQSEQITLSNDITDHIIEDHTMVQDHITIKPKVFTMRGLISEKVFSDPRTSEWNQWIENISNKLTPLKPLMPTVNSYFQSAINAYEAIEGKVEQIVNWGKSLKNLKTANWKNVFIKKANNTFGRWSHDYLQNQVMEELDALRINRVPITVITGWGAVYEPTSESAFYIVDVSLDQGDTYQQSTLSVTVKELRFTEILVTDLTNEKAARLQQQSQEAKDTVTGQMKGELKSEAYKASGRE